MLRTSEQMLGPQDRCAAIALESSMGREDLAGLIEEKIREWRNCLIMVDMIGGTPWNAAMLHGLMPDCEVLAGLSLPLLLEALSLRVGLMPRELGDALLQRAPAVVTSASRLLKEKAA